MKGLRQGFRPTKEKVESRKEEQPQQALEKEHDVCVEVIDLKGNLH